MEQENWATTEAEIVNCSLSWLRSDLGSEGTPARSAYRAEYIYEVNGRTYRHSMIIYDPDRIGEKFEIAYDPTNPDRNDAPGQTINLRDSRSILRHALIWGCGILITAIVIHYFPDMR